MERLMQYIWQHRLWPQADMRTVDGKPVSVIDPGTLNTNSGPDFFNAKISIDGHMWAGDVEIHVRASDWHRHGHDNDRAYDSVILHVVDRDDSVVRRPDGEPIPQMLMPCAPDFHLSYGRLVDRAALDLPCASFICDIPPIYLTDWMSTLAYERLYGKTDRIERLLERFKGDWESVCYVTMARCLGFGVNGDPFERLALSLPLIIIGKHADSPLSVEAMLFGQSGLLDGIAPESNDYVDSLRREYEFLSHKFDLHRPQSLGWKMSRMRPGNFPHRRIATLAAMLSGGFRMMNRMLHISDMEQASEVLSPQLTDYWKSHSNFEAASRQSGQALGATSVAGLVINAVVPLQMAYGMTHDDTDLTDRAVALLHSVAAERNSIVEMFARKGIKARDAFTSQALIQLRREYCEARKCLYCRIGHRMLASKARRRD